MQIPFLILLHSVCVCVCVCVLASEHVLTRVLRGSSIFWKKKLIIYIHYNLGFLHFSITKKPRSVMKNYFIRRVVLFFFFFFKEGKWSRFVGNILVEVKDISTYKTII